MQGERASGVTEIIGEDFTFPVDEEDLKDLVELLFLLLLLLVRLKILLLSDFRLAVSISESVKP